MRVLKAIGNYFLKLMLNIVTAVLVAVAAAVIVAVIVYMFWDPILEFGQNLFGG